jgi:ADP-ribose pyrophosphatase YjhB (NUDIX family)
MLKDHDSMPIATDTVLFSIAETEEDNVRKLPEQRLEVLLIKRGTKPYIGQWALPGGFLEGEETVGETALRELEEETGTNNVYLEQLYTFSEPKRDPRGRVLSCAFMSLIPKNSVESRNDSDASDAAWFDLEYERTRKGIYKIVLTGREQVLSASVQLSAEEPVILKNKGLAFDHAKIIVFAIERLREKLETTDIAFNLLPETFTLSEMQMIYEAISNEKYYPTAFRRKVISKVKATGKKTSSVGHRPSALYKRASLL